MYCLEAYLLYKQHLGALDLRTCMYMYYRIRTTTTKPLANPQCIKECTFTTHLSSTVMNSYPSAVFNFRKSTALIL
jgi:hypothetical protein